MRDPLKRITLVFIMIAALPIAFIFYELGQLNSNERIVRESYQNQLDAILYSVNQYADDIISSWANRARVELSSKADTVKDFSARFKSVINQTDVVRFLYFTTPGKNAVLYPLNDQETVRDVQHQLDEIVKTESAKLDRLVEYEAAGFRKMEAMNTPINGDMIPIMFALGDNTSGYTIGAIVVDLRSFIRNNLGPKMQEIAQGKLVISAFDTRNDSLIFSTELLNQSQESLRAARAFKSEIQKKNFWVLPGYYLGITLKGVTIDDLVRTRTGTSVTILVLLIVVLASGLFFLYRNIRKEIQLSQAKSEFVSNVSHEIRTPLSMIGMFAETLDAGRVPTEEKKKEYYGIIAKETTRLSKIVNRILNFSQMEANKRRFTMTPVQLNTLCQDVLKTYVYHLEDKGFEFAYEPAEDLGVVEGDREAIAEAFINLLDNAVKYSGERKHITVRTGRDHNYRFIEVRDEGIGIAKKHHHDIFEQFFRAPLGDIHTTKGSGLGLTLVRKIMEAHHGLVTVDSVPGKGSTFRLKFPVQKAEKT